MSSSDLRAAVETRARDERREHGDGFEEAVKRFPQTEFPWHVLPEALADSLLSLARSCATSPSPLPGFALAVLSSCVGSTVSVSPKSSWSEPLIFWCGDIRPSGTGKGPQQHALCAPLYRAQADADREYEREMQEWRALKPKERGPEPERARGFFISDLTLEGLREDHSGHGGRLVVLDELSSFISSQGQYKKSGGNDRESWLALFDGKPARIARAGKNISIRGTRVSIVGGIQHEVFRRVFGGEDGLFLADGTIFRFLPTFEGGGYRPLTAESWEEEHERRWSRTVENALEWADQAHAAGETRTLLLNEEAQARFLEWRNGVYQDADELPDPARGFIPKSASYALRLSGALHLLHRFGAGEDPGKLLTAAELERGIEAAEFYLGHCLAALRSLVGEEGRPAVEVTEQVSLLARALGELRTAVEAGKLAVGAIHEAFNALAPSNQALKNARRTGALLRRCGLTLLDGKYSAQGRRSVKCMAWNENTEAFLRRVNGKGETVTAPCGEVQEGDRTPEPPPIESAAKEDADLREVVL